MVAVDSYMSEFYKKVNYYWLENINTSLSHVSVISVMGGENDLQVPSHLGYSTTNYYNLIVSNVMIKYRKGITRDFSIPMLIVLLR